MTPLNVQIRRDGILTHGQGLAIATPHMLVCQVYWAMSARTSAFSKPAASTQEAWSDAGTCVNEVYIAPTSLHEQRVGPPSIPPRTSVEEVGDDEVDAARADLVAALQQSRVPSHHRHGSRASVPRHDLQIDMHT